MNVLSQTQAEIPKSFITSISKAHTQALKEHELFLENRRIEAESKAKFERIVKNIAIFDSQFQNDVLLIDTSELAGKVIRSYSQPCYDDGKYLFKSAAFCAQKKGAHEARKWVATFDKKGAPIWLCTHCKSVYPRKEKN